MTPTNEAPDDRAIVITRVFDAPAQRLYDAYRTPAQLLKWFGPVGYPLTMCEVDFRVGGQFRFAMTGPDGTQNPPFGGTYREIVPNRRIVYDNGFEAPGSARMLVTLTFDEADGRTTLTMHILFDTRAERDQHVEWGFVQGTASGHDQLAALVAAG